MRKLMIAVSAVAGLAMIPGCKRDNVEAERQDVAEAQQEATRETAEARQEAQEDIAGAQQGAQEEIASAQQDVQEERQDVAEAEQNRNEELAEDQREMNDDLAQGGSGTAGATAAATSVNARVISTGGDSLTVVDTSNNKQLKLKTNDQTRIMQNNAPVKLDDITEGSQVRASYVMDGKDMVARELTVTQPAQKKQ
ncbi:hypothetical protein ACLESO_51080 [Pyxidicoccus sp. 3LG]